MTGIDGKIGRVTAFTLSPGAGGAGLEVPFA